jgi:Lon protease-like protein
MADGTLLRVPVFPLAGALLFPRAQLPLHIFEPRYRAMIRDALAGNRLIAMVQPRDSGDRPALFSVGCLGHIASVEELADGRFNIVLDGLGRFRIAAEAKVDTLYRQVDADRSGFDDDADGDPLGIAQRAELEREARLYADALGYQVDWTAVSRLDDEMLVNGIAQIAPLDVGSKQALIEAADVTIRADLLVQFMQFQRMIPGGADGPETLQ